jgi:hypothetical protein
LKSVSIDEVAELQRLVSQFVSGVRDESIRELDDLYIEIADRTPPFDWNNWDKGLQGLKNAGAQVFDSDETYDPKVTSDSFEEFNRNELCQLLLMIHRVNRFSDEYYDDQLESGVILKILDRLLVTLDSNHSTQ